GVIYEELAYEGYGQGGVGIVIEVLTDNKNRSAAEVRSIFTKKGGNMAGAGSVSWQFKKKGLIIVDKKLSDEEKLMNIVLENGAEDMVTQDETYEITTSMNDFENVKKAVIDSGITPESAEITMIPSNTVKVSEKGVAQSIMNLIGALEDHDDVQNVYANFDIPDEILNELEA
ncbi:MAG: YebC/PmpR family DNA-binding transcriptional regulator, partial [Candidatus Heimdallarchaeota archaeon]|nr:YebC/PmpR family DNA-binding transcriptional regulator [Candidatus Heimdallarchaeota archaeon]